MKLKSFGCSFTYGSDLYDCTNIPFEGCSQSTWPALLAKSIDAEYGCYAHPGIGNLQIYQTILDQVSLTDSDFFIVNWTWLDRFDFIDPLQEHWNLTKEPEQYYYSSAFDYLNNFTRFKFLCHYFDRV